MICKTKDCKMEMYVLSYYDQPKELDKEGNQVYDRQTKYRCEAGHSHTVVSRYTPKATDVNDFPETPESKKRFHRKGFTGHAVNPTHTDRVFGTDGYSRDGDNLSNHERVLKQRKFRTDHSLRH